MYDHLLNKIIENPRWPEPIEVKLIEEVGDYVHIVGSSIYSSTHIDQLLPKKEIQELEESRSQMRYSAPSWKMFLALETIRYRYASLYDPLVAMNTSKVDPLPHQIEAVYEYILKKPRIRFLIADDPGAGKTIMAGLVIKELKIRHLVKRILIVAPGHLRDQWRREMKDRFKETFAVVTRHSIDALYGENIWEREDQIVTSLDFAKQEDILRTLAATQFDLVIVDEAHKMSAYQYGDSVTKTSRYKLGEVLSRNSEHLLFLTATPHKGDPENFRLFLDLIEPGFFATNEMVAESIRDQDNPLFIRRVKEDLKDFEGKPLFLPRHVKTIAFRWRTTSPQEVELYNELSQYVEEQYNKALLKDKRRNIAFALVILQRRLASSTYALLKSLERRRTKLQEYLRGSRKPPAPQSANLDLDGIEDMSEAERWREEEIWETLSVAENREELEKEIKTIDRLIQKAQDIIRNETEVKLVEFKNALAELAAKYPDPKDKKILVFTESKDTLEYLEKKVKSWGYNPNTIHGGMKMEDRIYAEQVFHNETDVMIATEAAGEGINLQFCHLMINYDIPWNPNRLEQRMGRIHRYGQQKEVYVFNLVASDTREGQVLQRLFKKIEEISQAMGSDKVFDVLSEVYYNKNLAHLITEAAANARDMDEILKEIDIQVDEQYISRIKQSLGESLATRFIDFTRIKEMEAKAREQRLIPEYTENYFRKAFLRIGGKLKERSDGFLAIESIPFELHAIAKEDRFRKSFGTLLKRYPKVTFDKDTAFKNSDAEFISFGHPLFEAVLTYIERNFNEALNSGGTFADPEGLMDGYLVFFEGEVKDGTGAVAGKRLFSFYLHEGEVKPLPASIIWDLAEIENPATTFQDPETIKTRVMGAAIDAMQQYQDELLEKRRKQTEIKRKYGLQSLKYLISKLDGELINLYQRRERGDNVRLAISNKEERMKQYKQAYTSLEKRLEKEVSLTMSMPRLKAIIRVVPETTLQREMRNDPEVEKIGMLMALEYERRHNRIPEDVSAENLGFDIRSQDPSTQQYRYIEVKARAQVAPVALTPNEWFKARRFKNDYYLYVVMPTSNNPKLHIIRNPAENLAPEEKVEVVRYLISQDDILSKGIPAD